MLDGKRIQELREMRNWDQTQLAEVAGIHPSVVSRVERNMQQDVKLSIAVSVAQALNVSVDSLLEESAVTSEELMLEATINQLQRMPKNAQRLAAGMIQGFINAFHASEDEHSSST